MYFSGFTFKITIIRFGFVIFAEEIPDLFFIKLFIHCLEVKIILESCYDMGILKMKTKVILRKDVRLLLTNQQGNNFKNVNNN